MSLSDTQNQDWQLLMWLKLDAQVPTKGIRFKVHLLVLCSVCIVGMTRKMVEVCPKLKLFLLCQ